MPTEGPERQEISNKGQSAYRRTRASRRYQQRPERLPKDQSVKKFQQRPERLPKGQSVKKLSAKARSAKLEQTTNDRHDGNHTRIGRSYTMAVPMNISSLREVGDPIVENNKATKEKSGRDPYQNKRRCKKKTTRQHATRRLRHLMHDKH